MRASHGKKRTAKWLRDKCAARPFPGLRGAPTTVRRGMVASPHHPRKVFRSSLEEDLFRYVLFVGVECYVSWATYSRCKRQLNHLARFPPDNAVRPSTLDGTDTPIEVQHELLIRLVFSRDTDDDQCEEVKGKGSNGLPLILSVHQPIVLSSVSPFLPIVACC